MAFGAQLDMMWTVDKDGILRLRTVSSNLSGLTLPTTSGQGDSTDFLLNLGFIHEDRYYFALILHSIRGLLKSLPSVKNVLNVP